MTNIFILSIPHSSQRYNTCGDWMTESKNELTVLVSECTDDSEFLVAIHELVEAYLCKKAGITQEMVDAFDLAYEGNEPGDNPYAPYHAQHKIAERVEKDLCFALGLTWEEHERIIDGL